MKKLNSLLLASILCVGGLVACDTNPDTTNSVSTPTEEVSVEEIFLGPAEGAIYLGEEDHTLTLTLDFLPVNATNKAYTIDTSDATVATVDPETLVITGHTVGTAVITATSVDGAKTSTSVISVLEGTRSTKISQLNTPTFYRNYKNNTAVLDKVENIQTNVSSGRSVYYENEEGTADIYKVGWQNDFKVNLTAAVIDENSGEESQINDPEVISEVLVFDEETDAYVSILESEINNHLTIDETNYKFTEAAVGNKYKIVASIDETKYSSVSSLCEDVVLEIEVIDAYNVYSVGELSLFDNRDDDYYDEIKEDLGIQDVDAHGLVLHSDLTITNADFPQAFRYTEAEVNDYIKSFPEDFANWCEAKGKNTPANAPLTPAEGKALLVDSLKDYTDIYVRLTTPETDFAFEGNYFRINAEQVKHVYAFAKNISAGEVKENYIPSDPLKGSDGSHTSLFNLNTDWPREVDKGGKIALENLTVTCNGERSNDDKHMGGLIAFKYKNVAFSAKNVISSKTFITFFSNIETDPEHKTTMTLDRCKSFDSYTSLVYIYGTDTNVITNSYITGAGGALFLLDEVNANNSSAGTHGTPKVDCYNVNLSNLVNGTEPWFNMHKASLLVQTIVGFGNENQWLGRNARSHEGGKNISTIRGDNVSYIDLIAIDICGNDPLGNSLSTGGSMLKGYFNVYNELNALVGSLDMSKLNVFSNLADKDAAQMEAGLAYRVDGNILPIYRLAAADFGAPGIIASTVTGGHGLLGEADGSNGYVLTLDKSGAVSPVPFFYGDVNYAQSNAVASKAVKGLTDADYLSIYMQPGSASVEYIGCFFKLYEI